MRAVINVIFMLLGVGLAGVAPPAFATLSFGPDSEAQGDPLDIIVAVVDDDVITRQELKHAVALIERQRRQKNAPLPPPEQLERQVLERLILTKLQQRAAERSSIVVDDNTLNATLERVARQNNLTLSQLRETLERDGISFAEFRESIRTEILASRLRQRMVDSRISISDQEVDSMLSEATPTTEAGQATPQSITQTRIRHILIRAREDIPAQEAQQRLQRLYERIQNGEDFAELARAHSEDTRSAVRGGELGWVSPGDLTPQFEEQMEKLEPNQVSGPFQTPFGWHIVQVLERRQQEGGPEAQRTKVREALFKRRVEEEWEQWLRRLRDEAYVEIRLGQQSTVAAP